MQCEKRERERNKEMIKNNAEVGGASNSKEEKRNRVFPKKLRGFGRVFPVIVVLTVFTVLFFLLLFKLEEKNRSD